MTFSCRYCWQKLNQENRAICKVNKTCFSTIVGHQKAWLPDSPFFMSNYLFLDTRLKKGEK